MQNVVWVSQSTMQNSASIAIYSVLLFCVTNCSLLLTSLDATRPKTPPTLSCHLVSFAQTLPRSERTNCTVSWFQLG